MTDDAAPGGLPSPESLGLSDDDRQRRVEALRALASQQPSVEAASHSPTQEAPSRAVPISLAPPRRQPLWLRVGALALLIAVIAGAALLTFRSTPRQPAATPPPELVELDLTAGRIDCPSSAAWSPNGAYIAAYGFYGDCNPTVSSAFNQTPPVQLPQTVADISYHVAIFDARHMRLLRSINLDALMERVAFPARIRDNNAILSTVNMTYQLVSWSPDSKTVAFLATGAIATAIGDNGYRNTPVVDGLLLVDATAGTARFIPDTQPNPTPVNNHPMIRWWDVRAGTLAYMPLMSGVRFSWDAADTLISSGQPDIGPVGTPDGGDTFTIYSHAQISLLTPVCGIGPQQQQIGPKNASPFYEIDAVFPVWSPDGRYVLDGVDSDWRLDTPVTDVPPVNPQLGGGCGYDVIASKAPAIPVRDAGLTAALQTLNANNDSMAASWSPSGRHLAVGQHQSLTLKPGIVVYDCVTGKVVATLDGTRIAPPNDPNNPDLQDYSWSPDGGVLLIFSTFTPHLWLWQLPVFSHS